MKASSKIIPNNSPLAVAARGGTTEKHHRPKEKRGEFKPWSDKQPKYKKWLGDRKRGQPCQCPDHQCTRVGEQIHHEDHGSYKDDRCILLMSAYCHLVVRQGNRGCNGWTAEQYELACRAVAGDNWREYETAMKNAEGEEDGNG